MNFYVNAIMGAALTLLFHDLTFGLRGTLFLAAQALLLLLCVLSLRLEVQFCEPILLLMLPFGKVKLPYQIAYSILESLLTY